MWGGFGVGDGGGCGCSGFGMSERSLRSVVRWVGECCWEWGLLIDFMEVKKVWVWSFRGSGFFEFVVLLDWGLRIVD